MVENVVKNKEGTELKLSTHSSQEERETSFEQILVENARKLARVLKENLHNGEPLGEDSNLMLAALLYFYGISDEGLLKRLDYLRETQHQKGLEEDARMNLMAEMLYLVLEGRGVDLS